MRLTNRLTRLERSGSSKVIGRIFRLRGGNGTEAEAESFLQARGYEVGPNDLVLCRMIYERAEGQPRLVPLSLEFIENSNTRHEDALEELK